MKEKFIFKFQHFGKPINILLVYPNTYFNGIANLGHQTVYNILNQDDNINCERYYLSQTDFKSIETQKFLYEFDIISFSVCYELDIFNIIKFLKHFNYWPLNSNNNRSVIISGGALTYINPELLQKISDYVILGDLENIKSEFIKFLYDIKSIKNINKKKYNFLYDNKKKFIKFLNNKTKHNIESFSSIISENSVFPNTFLLELVRGCPYSCSFCITGNTRNPVRNFNYDLLNSLIERIKKFNIKKIGFIGSSVLTYPNLENILNDLLQKNINFSFSSLNLNNLNKNIIDMLIFSGQNTITLAPEVSNKKLQKIINKNFEFNKFFDIINYSVKKGIKRLKLYFLYGFETETFSDLDDTINLLKQIQKITKLSNKPFNIIVSFNPVIPKPNTPLIKTKNYFDKKILKQKQKYLKSKLIKLGLRLEFLSIKNAEIQYELANNIDIQKFIK